jgi:pentatricopeptide repeat protein
MYKNNPFSSSLYPLSLHPYNIILRPSVDPIIFSLLVVIDGNEISGAYPDAVSYSTLLSSLCSAEYLDLALSFLPMMEEDQVKLDLVIYSMLMHLAMKLGDPSKAISLFSRMCSDT